MDQRRIEAAPAKARRLPWGFLGMLGLVIAIESTLAANDLDFTAPWHWDWRVIGQAATRPDKVGDKQILCFGDSLVKFGVMPKVLREASGKSTFNLALHTGQASSSYFMLRRALGAGAKPSAIVLDLTPHMLMHQPGVNKHLWPELLTLAEGYDLGQTMKDPDFLASLIVAKLLPSYKERHDLRAGLYAALQGRSTSRRVEIPNYRRNWKLNDGAQLMADTGAPTIRLADWVDGLYSRWDPDPVNVAYLERFLGLASSRQIPVYWLLPPIHPAVQAGTDANRFDLAYSNFVLGMKMRFPGTSVVDARHSGFPAEEFIDGAHLNRPGALKYSAALGQLLRDPGRSIEEIGWVQVDLGRVRGYSGKIEDVNQSAEAIRAEAAFLRR